MNEGKKVSGWLVKRRRRYLTSSDLRAKKKCKNFRRAQEKKNFKRWSEANFFIQTNSTEPNNVESVGQGRGIKFQGIQTVNKVWRANTKRKVSLFLIHSAESFTSLVRWDKSRGCDNISPSLPSFVLRNCLILNRQSHRVSSRFISFWGRQETFLLRFGVCSRLVLFEVQKPFVSSFDFIFRSNCAPKHFVIVLRFNFRPALSFLFYWGASFALFSSFITESHSES